jgi:WD40 repeat protein
LNTLVGIIPHRSTQRKTIINSILWHEPTQSLVTGSRDELTVTEMSRQDAWRATITTHAAPVTCMHYLPEFGHVLTADSNGTISSWNLCTGEQLVEFANMHSGNAVTFLGSCMQGCRAFSGVCCMKSCFLFWLYLRFPTRVAGRSKKGEKGGVLSS